MPPIARLGVLADRIRDRGSSPAGIRARNLLNILLSALILALLVHGIARVGWKQVIDAVPASPWFWLMFAGFYLLQPLVEWHIYRRWWHFGWESLGVFLKMRVMNDALFSYSGHTYMLVWAARHLGIEFDPKAAAPNILGRGNGPGVDPAASPFAAVKDMAITSGLAGNFATLMILGLALTMDGSTALGAALDPRTMRILLWSFAAMVFLNLAIVLLRGRVMSLPPRENFRALCWHLFRVVAIQALLVGSWAVALPGFAAETWFLLGALRMVIGRMPLPNKDILFAAMAVSLTGDLSVQVAALMAAQGGLVLLFHAVAWGAAMIQERAISAPGAAA